MSKERFVVDTSVFIEYIVENGPLRGEAEELLSRGIGGEVEVFVVPQVLSETLYVASRIYRVAGVENFNEAALDYVLWISGNFKLYDPVNVYVEAGELSKSFRIALTDCYVVAAAEALNAGAVFARPEKEMVEVLGELRARGVVFLADAQRNL